MIKFNYLTLRNLDLILLSGTIQFFFLPNNEYLDLATKI